MLVEIVCIVGHEVIIATNQDQLVVLILQLEVGMQLCDGIHLVSPYDAVSVSGDDSVQYAACGNLVFHRVVLVVTDIKSCHVEVGVGGVVDLKPVVVLETVVDVHAVGSTHLIDT